MWLQQQAVLPDLAWAWALPLLASAWGLPHTGRWAIGRSAILLAMWFALGFFYAGALAQQRMADTLPVAWQGVNIALVGVVASLPVTTERGQRMEFDVERVLTPGAVVPHHIQLSTYLTDFQGRLLPDAVRLHAAERWQLTVRLRRPHANQNPHVMDMEAVWFAHNIRALGTIYMRGANQRLTPLVMQPPYLIERLRERIAERFDRILADAPYAGVLKALAIGDQSAIPPAQWQLYQRTGITHLISISGLHVTMLSGLVFALCYAGWRRSTRLTLWLPARRTAVLAGALAALAYVVLAGFGVPAQRTLYMLWVVAIALWAGRTLAPTRILAWALLIVVLIDPWAVLAAGFWLSFGAVAALLFATGARINERRWWHDWWQSQWAVSLALAPILLLLFGQLSTVSPLANAVAIPLVSFVITPLVLAGTLPGLDALLHWAHGFMAALIWLLQMMAAWPIWQQAQPPKWAVVLAVMGALWWLLPRGFPARWLGAVWMLPALVVAVPQPAAGALWISVIDVGQGLAVLVRTAQHTLLFDTGPRYNSTSDSGSRILVPYLRGEGVTRLDRLVLSHDDNDHTGGAASLLDAVPVAMVLTSLPATHAFFTQYARPVSRCEAGQGWDWDGVHFAMLYPANDSYSDTSLKDNHRSCVLMITSAGGSVLLPADIEAPDEARLLQSVPQALRADWLIAPHHGSRTSSTADFIKAVQPKMTIFTVGYQNRYGHPRSDVVTRYHEAGSALRRSDNDGLISVRFTPGITPETNSWRQMQRHYWQDQAGINR